MAKHKQIPFLDAVSFVDNPEPRCPCVLLLDTSRSMAGAPIEQLYAGLRTFTEELAADPMAVKRVEIALVTFGPVTVRQDFVPIDQFSPGSMVADNDTPLGAAILKGLDLVQSRKQQYQANGIAYYRPWMFLITDGAPTDDWQQAAKAVRAGEENRALAFFAVGVDGADFSVLRQLSVREPLRLKGLMFRELFQWLSNSLSSVSRSQPDTQLLLPPPDTTPNGWASLD